jgi:hypothetical protein
MNRILLPHDCYVKVVLRLYLLWFNKKKIFQVLNTLLRKHFNGQLKLPSDILS